ncbi:DUF883 family protein [Litoreibacter arenae]|uniref:DUF883 domain-containing protein n=1 Tax=Litoreibacter arenae DSM 19593 TaxID=1123360 RepID=S9RZR2_9RHOB|nr:DUF883 family protein [Litoreibacter arenae]EPX79469.1 hypothetical protein thalar_02294 [Litoreibacter arenae DSM 19593]
MAQSKSAARDAEISAQELSDQIATLRADLSELTNIIGNLGKAKGAEMSNKAKDQLEALREEADARAKAMKDQALNVQAQAQDMIQNQPGAAIGIAAGLGFLVGFLSARK